MVEVLKGTFIKASSYLLTLWQNHRVNFYEDYGNAPTTMHNNTFVGHQGLNCQCVLVLPGAIQLVNFGLDLLVSYKNMCH